MTTAASINPDEAAFFGALADDWWNPKGSSAMLHRITPVRVAHIRGLALAHFGLDAKSRRPLAGLSALDVGCGAGLMAEPLARMGVATSAIDAAAQNIEVAVKHAAAGGLSIDYRNIPVEDLAATGAHYDLITCLEVVEHVAGRDTFFAAIASLLKPGGLAVFSTPNRTPASWAVVIAGAEYITRSIPRGAHDWNRFFTPAELAEALSNAGLTPGEPSGLTWRPGKGFHIGSVISVNYFLSAMKACQV
ncbi:bifunctional 2-polyprenyl-6-hydroxyphenol methylase/3-demethylubiquinol 3-O-methyltransferase UbiG [Sandarakinorhabdus sp.]|uniref:bifunctional 2-polyprenyl-6-hydroxyphenol methylase/3-demethylubiquinol 3-O-methyltransferase UbiG n=1 Tax=Sandarakinorhabdus sp. TaxID=1916663 RepID=UPI003342A472